MVFTRELQPGKYGAFFPDVEFRDVVGTFMGAELFQRKIADDKPACAILEILSAIGAEA